MRYETQIDAIVNLRRNFSTMIEHVLSESNNFYSDLENAEILLDDFISKFPIKAEHSIPELKIAADKVISALSRSVFYNLSSESKDNNLFSECVANICKEVRSLVQEFIPELGDLDKTNKISLSISLEEWLASIGIDTHQRHTVISKMKTYFDYSDTELSNLYQNLSSPHGRLFLNCLLRVCNELGIEAKTALESLSYSAATAEALSPPLAHVIWVGPPTVNSSELLAVRSLKNAYPSQPVCFWALEEHVQAYQEKIKSVGLLNVEVVSIENYAKKIDLKFGEQENESLLDQINFFKNLESEKVRKAEKTTDPDQKKLLMTDAIRDRVTIVDHIKPLIPLFLGGYVFDADLIFSRQVINASDTLPRLSKWTFPFIINVADVWFFYCHNALRWNGEKEKHPEERGVSEDLIATRDFFLQVYNKDAKKIYAERGEKPIDGDFPFLLGAAICNIAPQFPLVSYGDKEKIFYEDLQRLYRYHYTYPTKKPSFGSYLVFGAPGVSSITLVVKDAPTLVKYYGQSYVPNDSQDAKEESDYVLQIQLFYLNNDRLFCDALKDRHQLTNFDVTKPFKIVFELRYPRSLLSVSNITMPNLALLIRPTVFSAILSKIPLEKMTDFLAREIDFPSALFEKIPVTKASGVETHTLLSLAKKVHSDCEQQILDTEIIARIFNQVSANDDRAMLQAQWRSQGDPEKILEVIVELAKKKNTAGHSVRFMGTSVKSVNDVLSEFGVTEFTKEGIREKVRCQLSNDPASFKL